jgi:hypothetical protein
MMKAIRSSETSFLTKATQRNIPEYGILQVPFYSGIQLGVLPILSRKSKNIISIFLFGFRTHVTLLEFQIFVAINSVSYSVTVSRNSVPLEFVLQFRDNAFGLQRDIIAVRELGRSVYTGDRSDDRS